MRHRPHTSRFQLIAYALPAVPLAIILFPAYAILPSFYAHRTHIPLATIGAILLISRLFDAIIDPAIGYLSDKTRTRWGSRKPWLVVGAVAAAVTVYRLYVPPADADWLYYATWFLLFYLAFTLIEIPHKAWGTDIVRTYMERSEVSTYLGMAFAIGNLAFATVPFIPAIGGSGYDATTLRVVALLVIALLPLTVGTALWFAPQGQPVAAERITIAGLVLSAITNRPFLRFLLIFVLAGFGQGIFYGAVFLYVGSLLRLGTDFPYILLADALCTLIAVPVWFRLIGRFEKHRAWGIGMMVSASAIAGMWLTPPGLAGFPLLVGLIIVRAAGGAVIYVAPHALLGDVVDYDILRTRSNRAGNYHALMALVTKANGAAGGGLALVLIGVLGFKTGVANTADAIVGFKMVVLALSSVIIAGSAIAAWTFPLDRRRHDIVRRRIQGRVSP